MVEFAPAIPIFRIFDEPKAREFYLGFLGFDVDFEHRFSDDAPVYLGVSRDGFELHLSEHHGDGTPGTRVRVQVSDIKQFHADWRQRTTSTPSLVFSIRIRLNH
jgi:catechol 2,3-dioxygenase-like lactoylglutathione lyase family enzyme